MTIKELKNAIKDFPDDMKVIVQKDAEGNGYSPLAGVDNNAIYVPLSSWHGETYNTSWTHDEACLSVEEWNELKSKPRVAIIFPVN